MPSNKIVKNTSKAGDGRFGFNYASLADIQEQGFEVPKMRIRPIFTPDGTTYVGDYMEYYDEATKEWNLGSRIISEKMGSMNAQQSRGSSESYARRYTTMMALGLAGQDDKNVEADGIEVRKKSDADNDPDGQNNSSKDKPLKDTETDFRAIQATVDAIDDIDSLSDYYRSLDVAKKLPATQNRINSIINKRKKELKK